MPIKIDHGFLMLTWRDSGKARYVKGSAITSIEAAEDSGSMLWFDTPSLSCVIVRENPNEILQAIGDSYRQARGLR